MADRRDRAVEPARPAGEPRAGELRAGELRAGEPRASELRAANSDRQAVVDRLQQAFVEGRLQLHEYDERVALAYQAVTYADLTALFTDLPADNPIAPPAPKAAVAPAKPAVRHPGLISDMPIALQILWTIWISVMLINLVVWTILELSQGQDNFWPVWFLVPGAVLLGVTVGVTGIRRGQRSKRLQKSLKAARKRG
ncbi:MAG TPA: DUF1707 domain-containing protein [Jatrophihabitans sp.]|nr:DUF1707 domain-containing protein [Jatrophihabitans sp.]